MTRAHDYLSREQRFASAVQHVGLPGVVYLVGAGPGDPGLLTRRGADALACADVVIYDRLADDSLLALAPPEAELVYVGKQAALHALPQAQINDLLVAHAAQGKCVVRLKGGDPFVFGRGGEEASHLRASGIPYVVVPGVTSAVAAPAYAGIPVTDRRYASSFAVVTGHEDPDKSQSRLDWQTIAGAADTLVFVMGLTNLPRICQRLIDAGRPSETPAAVIERGTTNGQRVVLGTLGTLVQRTAAARLHAPALVVVGDVVRLAESLSWHRSQPLAGRRVLIVRAGRHSSHVAHAVKESGAEVVEVPYLHYRALPARRDLCLFLQGADWLVFTSAWAVRGLLAQVHSLGCDVRALGTARLAAVDQQCADSLARLGLRVDFIGRSTVPFATAFPAQAGTSVVVIGEKGGTSTMVRSLVRHGYRCHALAVFSSRANAQLSLPPLAQFDAVVLSSALAVRRFAGAYMQESQPPPLVVGIGRGTARTAQNLEIRLDVQLTRVAPAAIVQFLARVWKATTGSVQTAGSDG